MQATANFIFDKKSGHYLSLTCSQTISAVLEDLWSSFRAFFFCDVWDSRQNGKVVLDSDIFFRDDSTLNHVTIQLIQL